MKKSYLFIAAAALFAACSSDSLTVEKDSPQNPAAAEQAVNFSAYTSRGGTRSGLSGELNNTTIQYTKVNKGGFGVFGYYTDGELYAGNTKPNFFYNQGVFYNSGGSGTKWEYSPVKYWPNEFGTDAISDQVDRVTLFAYAPYVEVDPLTGIASEDNTKNITGMTRNNATGDPLVKYTATMDPTNTVDLCYAVAAEDFTSSNSTSFPNKILKGEPYIDLTKPGLSGVIKFDFKHALAKLNVQVDYDVNEASHGTTTLDPFTKIWVRSVTFEGITTKGALNLNGGDWYQIDASGDNRINAGTVTVYDGLKDGKEPMGKVANEVPATLNPTIIQSVKYDDTKLGTGLVTTDATIYGVATNPQNLFKCNPSGLTEPVYVIPTGEIMSVTIVYDVETYDPNLAYYLSDGVTRGSTIQNTITKTIDSFGKLQPGKQYVLQLHLGMRSVDFDAVVTDWDTAINNNNTDLPSNLPSYSAVALADRDSKAETVTLDADVTKYEYQVRGLTPGESLTLQRNAPATDLTAKVGDVDASGYATLTATLTANTTVKKITTGWSIVGGNTSGKWFRVDYVQLPHALGLNATSTNGSKDISLTKTASGTWSEITNDATHIKVWKNGTALTWKNSAPTASSNEFQFDAANSKIILGTAAATGNKYTISIQAGDAPEETVNITTL